MSQVTDAEAVTIPLATEDHKAGCPAERVESYEATRPATETTPSRVVTVTRCGDCGGHRVRDADMATVIRALNKKGNTDGRKQRPERPELRPDAGSGKQQQPDTDDPVVTGSGDASTPDQ